MADRVSEALVVQPLPTMIEQMGLAVARANAAMIDDASGSTVYAIHSAEVDLKIAVTLDEGNEIGAGGEVGFSAVAINATYARTYNFKEEASSSIKVQFSAVPGGTEQVTAEV